jgi:hypothetical protein
VQHRLQAGGPVPADVVWDRYRLLRLWSGWSPQISGVESDADEIAPGVTGKVLGPLRFPVRFTIDAVDATDRTWSWRVGAVGATLRLDHRVLATDEGSRTTLDVEGFLPVVLGYLPLAQLALHRLVTLDG